MCYNNYDQITESIIANWSADMYELETATDERIRKEMPSVKHYVSLEQIHTWLSEEGFRIEKEYGDYAGNSIGETTGRAIICAVLNEA